MIWQLVKKQGISFIRNPVQLLLLIGMPIILILILGVALSGIMDGEMPEIKIKLGFVQHESEQMQADRFMDDIAQMGIPIGQLEEIEAGMEEMMPVRFLKETVFGNEEMEEIVTVIESAPGDKAELLDDNTYTAIIEVPANFTYEMMQSLIFGNGNQPVLKLYRNDQHGIGSGVVATVLQQFQEQYALISFVGEAGLNPGAVAVDSERIGDQVIIDKQNAVDSRSYYTIGMAVMNVLFIASTIGAVAFREKKEHVFNRMLLGNISRWTYFTGIFLAGAIYGFIHLLLIYGFAAIVFSVTWPNIAIFLLVTISYAAAVGGLTVLLTAISYRVNSDAITGFFSSVVVTLMAFLGGSFFPIGENSPFMNTLGNLMPNGAGMSSYLAVIRGASAGDIQHYLLYLILFAAAAIGIAAWSFPKRGVTS